ncbi:hypothetical protein [Paraburkholderia sp.]|nr:hypothetical protein [Paraburkholderia sp.]
MKIEEDQNLQCFIATDDFNSQNGFACAADFNSAWISTYVMSQRASLF